MLELKELDLRGLQAKGIEKRTGHEGETLLSSNIYYKGKKVATYIDSDYGGGPMININKPKLNDVEEFKDAVADFYLEVDSLDSFVKTLELEDLFELGLSKLTEMSYLCTSKKTAILVETDDCRKSSLRYLVNSNLLDTKNYHEILNLHEEVIYQSGVNEKGNTVRTFFCSKVNRNIKVVYAEVKI